jgi:hypothetical protein
LEGPPPWIRITSREKGQPDAPRPGRGAMPACDPARVRASAPWAAVRDDLPRT